MEEKCYYRNERSEKRIEKVKADHFSSKFSLRYIKYEPDPEDVSQLMMVRQELFNYWKKT